MKLKFTVLMAFVMVASIAVGQKLSQTGDLTFLQGQSQVNVEFVYDGLTVGKKDRMPEQEYIDESMAKREEAEMGGGQKWLEGWETAREKHYRPAFLELINKVVTKKEGTEFGSFPDAKYTLVFHTTMIEAGWNIGIMKQAAEIDGVAYFYETANMDQPLAEVSITGAPGSNYGGGDYDVASRVKESYAISGKRLGAHLRKKAY